MKNHIIKQNETEEKLTTGLIAGLVSTDDEGTRSTSRGGKASSLWWMTCTLMTSPTEWMAGRVMTEGVGWGEGGSEGEGGGRGASSSML